MQRQCETDERTREPNLHRMVHARKTWRGGREARLHSRRGHL